MGKEVERLQASRFSEICCICVCCKCNIGIRCVCQSKIRDKVVEAAVVCVADWTNAGEHLLRCFRRGWRPRYKGESIYALQ